MKALKKIVLFISFFILYKILREFIEIYLFATSVNIFFGYIVVLLIIIVLVYFVVLPLINILKFSTYLSPTKDRDKVEEMIKIRFNSFKSNKAIKELSIDLESYEINQDGYDKIITELSNEAKKIQQKHISQLFYSTSISQNKFLDSLLIISKPLF